MKKRALRMKLEQFRQASAIHGGMFNLCLATLGIKLARVKIPSKRLRGRLYRQIYGGKYAALNEAEMDSPLSTYPSLNALFTRGVRPDCRPIADAPDQFLCPCDGTIQDIGKICRRMILTVKGIEYDLGALLPHIDVSAFEGGRFAILFLSPSDCHRVFSPHDGRLEEVIHVPGYRLLVHPPYQKKEYPVFTLNERVILRLGTTHGGCILVLVAGWGVGNITIPLDSTFRPRQRMLARKAYRPPMPVQRGEWLGTFELGSTVILLTPPAERVTTHFGHDHHVRYGQPIFSLVR
jgi:phosphatidylserine decarboxylase